MDDYEQRYYEESDAKDVSKIRDKKWWQKWQEDGEYLPYSRLMVHHQETWGRRWCGKGGGGAQFWTLVQQCVEKLGGPVKDGPQDDSSDSEADWMHLEPKDKEEEEAFEKRVEIRRLLNGVAERKRHGTRKDQKMKKQEERLRMEKERNELEMENKRKAEMKRRVMNRQMQSGGASAGHRS